MVLQIKDEGELWTQSIGVLQHSLSEITCSSQVTLVLRMQMGIMTTVRKVLEKIINESLHTTYIGDREEDASANPPSALVYFQMVRIEKQSSSLSWT